MIDSPFSTDPSLPDPTSFTPTDARFDRARIERRDLDEFRDALLDRGDRLALGLHIPDSDALLLLNNVEWLETFYRQWNGEGVTPSLGAPVAHPRTESVTSPARSARRDTVATLADALRSVPSDVAPEADPTDGEAVELTVDLADRRESAAPSRSPRSRAPRVPRRRPVPRLAADGSFPFPSPSASPDRDTAA